MFDIGSKVITLDGSEHVLSNLVLDPTGNDVVDLVVAVGGADSEQRIVSVVDVGYADSSVIRLNIADEDLGRRRRFRMEEMSVIAPEPTGSLRQAMVWVDPYQGANVESLGSHVPVTRVQLTRGVGDRAVIVGRNTEVFTRGGRRIGTVDHVAVDPVSMEPQMLVVRMPGIRRRRVMVTAEEVLSWERTGIILTLRRHDLHALPPYSPHVDDKTVVSAVRDALQNSIIRVIGLDVTSSGGHVTVSGHTDSDDDRRAADRLVRTARGVVTLDNELTTDRILSTRVQARLDDDPIAGLYPVLIEAERARIRLSGVVPNSAIHAIVLDVTHNTPGVASTTDDLAIRPEDFQGLSPAAAPN